jgi:hypothetical protein
MSAGSSPWHPETEPVPCIDIKREAGRGIGIHSLEDVHRRSAEIVY